VENPNRHILRSALLVVFGMVLGLIPGAIRFDQMRRQVDAELAESTKLNDGLRAAIADEKQKHAAEHADCQNAILGDGARTILVDLNHPLGTGRTSIQIDAALVMLPQGNPALNMGPMWVVPRAINPRVIDGALGGAYTHIWPDGRTDGWHTPARAE
jgi:hypothetical protein